MHNLVVALATLLAKKQGSLLLAALFGLIIGGYFIVWPIYYHNSGMAARNEVRKRETLPARGTSVNKYGHVCPYLAVITLIGEKRYYPVGQIAPFEDTPQQYYCTERQAQDAGYRPI